MPSYPVLLNHKGYPPVYPPVYHHRGRWPHPLLNPPLHRSTSPFVHVRHSPVVVASPTRHRGRGHRRSRSGSRGPKQRYVRFADQPVIIELQASPPHKPPSPTRGRLRCLSRPPSSPTSKHSHPAATAPSRQVPLAPARHLNRPPSRSGIKSAASPTASATANSNSSSGLHDLLAAFPPGLWDLRRTARPPYHPQHEPHYADPAFVANANGRKRVLTLLFRPCARGELAWTTTVKAASCGKHLKVGDVLGAISTELFRRSACRELRAGTGMGAGAGAGEGKGEGGGEGAGAGEGEEEAPHPCYKKARKAQRVRTRRGHMGRAHFDDEFRNVDLFHVDHGTRLFFEGLRPERMGDGEVVYVVEFSCT